MISGKILIIPLIVGFSLILIGFVGNPIDPFDDPIIEIDSINNLFGLSIIDVPIDPTTNQILGTVKFGAPIVVPFERSGSIISADGACTSLVDINNPKGKKEIKFGRLGSGETNAEVAFHGWNGLNCAYGYAMWDLTKLPNSFEATGFTFQLNLKQKQTNQQRCYIGFVDDTLDEITARNLPNRMIFGSNTGGFSLISTSLVPEDKTKTDFLAVGHFIGNFGKYDDDWCESTGVKRWTFSQIEATDFLRNSDGTIREPIIASGARLNQQAGVDAFNRQLQFDPTSQLGSDKFLLVFYSSGTGSGINVIDHDWWEENGSLLVTGTSQPIDCDIGFTQVGFECVRIICSNTQTLNRVTNECEDIICDSNQTLEIIQELVACPTVCIDDPFTPTFECGGSCSGGIERAVCVDVDQLTCLVILDCQEGTQPDSRNCGCEQITCPSGKELKGSNCQDIICPLNTRLTSNNDCVPIICASGQVAIDNVCQIPVDPITNQTGICEGILGEPVCGVNGQTFSNFCFAEAQGTEILHSGQCMIGENIPDDCPAGTIPQQNVCVKIVPNLLQISDELPPVAILIVGAIIVALTIIAIAIRSRR